MAVSRLRAASPPLPPPVTPRAFSCRCGRPVFFRNSVCLACQTPLGYDPVRRLLMPLEPAARRQRRADVSPLWRQASGRRRAVRYVRCANLDTAAACNWLVSELDSLGQDAPLCACCRLTRTRPDLGLDNGALWWSRIELAKRRVVSTLIALQLPVQSKVNEDPDNGLAFDLLRTAPDGAPVITGHANGVITLDIEEADDSGRERRREALREPYRTLLGHLRHETGHYYWQRLVQPAWLEAFRSLFGDERADYTQALKQHYEAGPPPDWGQRHVSAYASSHPWEDWAETWAHYLHLVDTLDTARSFGLDGERVELQYEPYAATLLDDSGDADASAFLALIHSWMELTGVLNELSRSMGVADFYPFVLSQPAVRKLHLVHRVIGAASAAVPARP